MASKRRNVKFPHRGSNDLNGRRPSISELSDATSDPGSPTKQSMDGYVDSITEEVGASYSTRYTYQATFRGKTIADPPVSRKILLQHQNTTRRKKPSSHGRYGHLL